MMPSHLCLQEVGQQWIADVHAQDPNVIFRMGFHAIPSMTRLHLHIISQVQGLLLLGLVLLNMGAMNLAVLSAQDFISDRLKSKKHFNSFTTPFFLELSSVIEELTSSWQGRLLIDTAAARQHEQGEMRCHRCRAVQRNMPQLKQHLLQGCR